MAISTRYLPKKAASQPILVDSPVEPERSWISVKTVLALPGISEDRAARYMPRIKSSIDQCRLYGLSPT